jgi:hypothetical protein
MAERADTLLGTVAPKLAKLLPLLGSDRDGEVLGAARAVKRTLASAGCDLHDLAASVTRPEPLPRIVDRDRPPPPPPGSEHSEIVMARSLVRFLLDQRPHALTPKEGAFLRGLLDDWLDAGRRPSPKQFGWLRDIHVHAESRS